MPEIYFDHQPKLIVDALYILTLQILKPKTKLYNNNMEMKPKDITLQNINIFRVMAEGIPRSLSVNLLIIARNRPLASLERELGLNKVPTDVYCRSECIKEF